jgi:hypothetical protein
MSSPASPGNFAARSTTLAFIALGVLFLAAPDIGRWLDHLAGAPQGLANEQITVTTTTEQIGSGEIRTSRSEVSARSPYVDGGLLGVALAVPGLLFFVRLGVIVLVALLAGGAVQAIWRARFDVHVAGWGLSSGEDIGPSLQAAVRSLDEQVIRKTVRTPPVADQPPGDEKPGGYQWVRAQLDATRATVAEYRTTKARRYENVDDPDLALAALRVDLEQGLRLLAARNGIDADRVPDLVTVLQRAGVITPEMARSISRLLLFGDRAAHGHRYPPWTLEEVRQSVPALLKRLDELVDLSGPPRHAA